MRTSRRTAALTATAAIGSGPALDGNVVAGGEPVLTAPAIGTADDVPRPEDYTARGT
ncbi:hypothetical protein ACF08M_23310 [Streptomyces sp. NPDC015032]|uniref:hypothetical protein n=1 Tax=Streptomyces sp. NPDC015032 TaxID=3364937 RepID=UPI0036F8A563